MFYPLDDTVAVSMIFDWLLENPNYTKVDMTRWENSMREKSHEMHNNLRDKETGQFVDGS